MSVSLSHEAAILAPLYPSSPWHECQSHKFRAAGLEVPDFSDVRVASVFRAEQHKNSLTPYPSIRYFKPIVMHLFCLVNKKAT